MVIRNIVVVDAISTGVNFVRDIVNINYNPIVLQSKIADDESHREFRELVDSDLASIDVDFELIHEKDTYEETLSMVREYDPLVVVAGSEGGVVLATKLANDLNLQCNPIENIDAMTLKHKMQEKIAEHGLRHIRGRLVKSVEEAIEFYDEQDFGEVVVKPVYSAGSVGVKICSNKEEMIDAITELFSHVNIYGDKITELVVQECISGEEYIVNTVSHNGNHRITLIWKYTKVKTEEGGYIYDSVVTINDLGLGHSDLVEYAYDVADALGIRYGPVHGEYMIDEKGPVLIEVNCRPCGANMDAKFLDRISGQHETDSILDSYLNPQKFVYEQDRGYKLYAHGCLKLFIVPNDIVPESSPMRFIGHRLKSHYKTAQGITDGKHLFAKTQDLETSGGIVYLVHEDGYVLQKDLDFLRSIEKYTFELVLSEAVGKPVINEDVPLDRIKSIIATVKSYGSTLFITDQILDDVDVLQITPGEIGRVRGEFNCIVVNVNKTFADKKDDLLTLIALKIIDKVKVGGLIFIPESTYQYATHGRITAEALVKALGLQLELPLHNLKGMVVASKR